MSNRVVSGMTSTILLVNVLTLALSLTVAEVGETKSVKPIGATDGSVTEVVDWWPMFHHDPNHTGYSTSKAPNTNHTIWSYTTGNHIAYCSPAVAYGKVYIGSYDHKVYCLNASTGTHIWNYTTGNWVDPSPAVVDGKVYVGSNNGKVYCLNASNGAHIWNYKTGDRIRSSPSVVEGKVYIGSYDRKIYCLDASTGTHIWNYTTGDMVVSSPAVADGKVYVGSWDKNVYCLDASTGTHIWNYTTGNSIGYSSPAVADGKVYVGSMDYKVYCLDASTGAFMWSYKTGDRVNISPAVAGGKVYVGSRDNKIYAFGPVHDVAVTKVTPSKTVVGQGFSLSISVTVENEGAYTETFNVTASVNTTILETTEITLTSRNSKTLTFTWNTTGFAIGNHTIRAEADVVTNETDTADNTYVDGIVTVRLPAHDVSIVNITTIRTAIAEGYKCKIFNATIENQGDFPETFNVTAYAFNVTELIIETKTVMNLPPSANITLTFTWNTTGVPKQYYTLKAVANTVPSETETGDNTLTNDQIRVVIPGNVNGDGTVNMADIYTELILRFLCEIGDPCYATNSDINSDGIINMQDIYTAIIHFMETEP